MIIRMKIALAHTSLCSKSMIMFLAAITPAIHNSSSGREFFVSGLHEVMASEASELDNLLKAESNTRVVEEYIHSIKQGTKDQKFKNSLSQSEFFHSLWVGPLDREKTQIVDIYTLANKGYIVVICLNNDDSSFRFDCSYAKPKITRDDYAIQGRGVK